MKSLLLAVLPVMISAVSTGEIFGDLRLGDEYLGDTEVQLTCNSETVKVKTDSAGSFRIKAKSTGKCAVTVTYEGHTAKMDVVVFEKAARYRLVLEKKDDAYVLKRV